MRKKQTLKLILFTFLTIIQLSCSSSQKQSSYPNAQIAAGESAGLQLSSQKIENNTTYMIYFTLFQPERDITVTLSTSTEKFGSQKATVNYFTIEREIKTSQFKKGPKSVWSQIGINYDQNWITSKKVKITSDPADPIIQLTPGLYRIKFTVINESYFKYELTVESRYPVKIDKSL